MDALVLRLLRVWSKPRLLPTPQSCLHLGGHGGLGARGMKRQPPAVRRNVGSLSKAWSSKCCLAHLRFNSLGEAPDPGPFSLWRLTFPTHRLEGAGGGKGRLRASRGRMMLDSGRRKKVLVPQSCPTLQPHGLSMEFSRQEYCSGLPFSSPGDLPDMGIEPGSPELQADSLPSELPGKPPRLRKDL